MFPYLNLSTCEFCQNIEEVTDFKLVYEYIFAIVSLFNFCKVTIYVSIVFQKKFNNRSTLFVSYQRKSFVQAKFIPAMDGNEVRVMGKHARFHCFCACINYYDIMMS